MKIADGIAPIPAMVEAGVCISLGTDGGMWNNSNDLFREMKGMMLLHTVNSGIRSLKTTDVLDMATINGARTFGLEHELGTIEVGKRADLILIDAGQAHLTPLRLGPRDNVASTVVFSATGQDVSDVFIGGQPVVRQRQILTIDLQEIRRRVAAVSEKVAGALAG
jgi:5-methylthioadenosine/S-adenosylhomocysteine deaminase